MSQQPSITVLYFAAASTATGLAEECIALPKVRFPLSSLTSLIISRHPNKGLENILATSSWSVNAEMVEDPEKTVLNGGEEVAVICPVSGG